MAVAAGYGLLSTVSVLPGFFVLVLGRSGTSRRSARSSSTQMSSPSAKRRDGGAQGVGEAVPALEPQPGDAVAHEERGGGHQ